jgi:hypothetical protein
MKTAIKNSLLFVSGFLACYLLFTTHVAKAAAGSVSVLRLKPGETTSMNNGQVVGFSCVQHEGNADCYVATEH